MNTDFHYYGTGTAARAAGFNVDEAKLIANSAQFVDFFDSNYWSNWVIVAGPNYWSKNLMKFSYPHLSAQTIDYKMAIDYNPDIWNAFHFPPGNRALIPGDYPPLMEPLKQRFLRNHQVREVGFQGNDSALLCRPYSQFILDMVKDTIDKYNLIRYGSNWEDSIKSFILPQVRYFSPQISRDNLALMLLGIRMHVLADTWAHQDFTGMERDFINGAGFFNNVYATLNTDQFEKVTFTNTMKVWAPDNDCAAAPALKGLYKGHGQMGHYPDYGWLKLQYPAAWVKGGGPVIHDNPAQYMEAWSVIAQVTALCLNNTNTIDIPPAIQDAIIKKFPLSPVKLSAVDQCEKNWAAGPGNELTGGRWGGMAPSKELGIKAGFLGQLLPLTRFGDVWIINGSILHLFELASVIHYQWSVRWAKAHPEYAWPASEFPV